MSCCAAPASRVAKLPMSSKAIAPPRTPPKVKRLRPTASPAAPTASDAKPAAVGSAQELPSRISEEYTGPAHSADEPPPAPPFVLRLKGVIACAGACAAAGALFLVDAVAPVYRVAGFCTIALFLIACLSTLKQEPPPPPPPPPPIQCAVPAPPPTEVLGNVDEDFAQLEEAKEEAAEDPRFSAHAATIGSVRSELVGLKNVGGWVRPPRSAAVRPSHLACCNTSSWAHNTLGSTRLVCTGVGQEH